MSILSSVLKGILEKKNAKPVQHPARESESNANLLKMDDLVQRKHQNLSLADVHQLHSISTVDMPCFNIYHVDINKFNKLYEDIICALKGALTDLGYTCTVSKNNYSDKSINILIGSTIFASRSHDLTHRLKAKPYIVYQLEQLDDKHGLLQEFPEYSELLRNASAILDYAPSSANYLIARGFLNVYYLPPAFHRSLESFRPRLDQDIDVLYFGSPHDRRLKILRDLKERGLSVTYLPDTFGKERNNYIARSKIILNIHAWDDLNVLETIRLSLVLANRGFVISEISDHNPYEEGVVYAPYDGLVEVCIQYLNEPASVRNSIAQQGYLILRKTELAQILIDAVKFIESHIHNSVASAPGSPFPDYYSQKRSDIVELIPHESRRILDIGCAGGEVGDSVKQRQICHITGIEIVAEAALAAAKVLDFVLCGDALELLPSLPDSAYDCVVMADVLEHVANSAGLLKLAHRKMSNGGLLVLCVSNVGHWSVLQGLLAGRWDYTDQGILDRTHLRFFTLSSLMELLEESGFYVLHRRSTILLNAEPSAVVVDAARQYAATSGKGQPEINSFQFQLICRKIS